MEIYLSKRAMQRVRLSVADAIEDGEIDALREDLISLFSDDDVEEIESTAAISTTSFRKSLMNGPARIWTS